tara:strand:+ start:295 stop:1953 length:1659 start_codon:yes stop_codon:yes gene_type:complete
MAELFGYEIKRKKESDKAKSFVAPSDEEGTLDIAGGAGFFGQYLSYDKAARNEYDLIRKYRTTAENPECDQAIEDIINEAIIADELDLSVKLNLDWVPLSMGIKKKMVEEFNDVLTLLQWKKKGHDIFRRWYVDGRIFYHKLVDEASPRKGITEVRYIDPKFIKKVREVNKTKQPNQPALVKQVKEWFLYNETGVYPVVGTSTSGQGGEGIRISPDAIVYVTSGIYNPTTNQVYGHLQKAIKPTNQLRMIEDSVVIYRISRAPERRIFYIDVGNLPKPKAEAYLKDVMTRYRNKLVYDASTGEVKDDRNQMSMLEDFWLPRREGGRGTEITTLGGGQNLGELEDVKYFQKKLYKSLNIPISRLEDAGGGFNLGRSTEITRDEIKFSKFIQRLRKKFGELFQDILKTQLILKGIITDEDWTNIKEYIIYDFQDDNHFQELKDMEILKERIDALNNVNEFVGTYYSVEYIRRYILRQSDTEIEEIDKQIEDEKKKGVMGDDAGTPPGEPNQGGFAGMAGADPYGNGGDTGQNYTQPGGTEFQASPDQEYTGPET